MFTLFREEMGPTYRLQRTSNILLIRSTWKGWTRTLGRASEIDQLRHILVPDVEGLLAAVLDHVLVAADPGGLKVLRGQLLQLVRQEVHGQGELVNPGLGAGVEKWESGRLFS